MNILDLSHLEENQANGELVISYLPKTDKVCFMELKSSKTTPSDFNKLLEANLAGCKIVYELMKKYVLETSMKKLICSK
jgi:RNase PH